MSSRVSLPCPVAVPVVRFAVTPVVALFGPTVEQFGFFPYTARAVVLQRALECRPCSAMGGARCPLGHHRCLMDITPDDVIQAATESAA